LGFDAEAWNDQAAMGWAGVVIPETFGGSDFGYLSMGMAFTSSVLVPALPPWAIRRCIVNATLNFTDFENDSSSSSRSYDD
jgi:Acyl-CoA dehydrogenase, N-terminal domain